MKNKETKVMTVEDIISNTIKEIGGDGLCNVELECACDVDDLAPCSSLGGDCMVAKKTITAHDDDYYKDGDEVFTPLILEENGG